MRIPAAELALAAVKVFRAQTFVWRGDLAEEEADAREAIAIGKTWGCTVTKTGAKRVDHMFGDPCRPSERRRPGRPERERNRGLSVPERGRQHAQGQNKVPIGPASSSTSFPASEIKNGNLSITTNPAVLTAPATVSGAAAGCPNPNWSGVNPVLTVTSITLVISQPPGYAIFTCSASNPNGLSGTVALSC